MNALAIIILHLYLFLYPCFTASYAEKRIGFEVEHLFESAMNARYLALPLIPHKLDVNETRLQLGLLGYSASRAEAGGFLLGAQHYLAKDASTGYMFSVFSDYIQFNEKSGASTFDPAFINDIPIITPLNININSINGNATHLGFTASIVNKLSSGFSWQFGAVIEMFDINQFDVHFNTVDELENYSGIIDYSEIYTAFTPFFTIRKYFKTAGRSLKYSTRLVGAWPLPRQGFSGRLVIPGHSFAGNTDDAGNGTHIPDPFLGLGLSISNTSETINLDIGASLYFYLVEGLIHEGVENPVMLTFSLKM